MEKPITRMEHPHRENQKGVKQVVQAKRRSEMTWNGNLVRGNGEVKVGSGVAETLPMTWASRIEQPDGKTSPEELLAAAHAGCYAMTLAEGGTPPRRLRVSAVCTLGEEVIP